MFWKSTTKEVKQVIVNKDSNNSSTTTGAKRTIHHFHDNPAKKWGYYDDTAKPELIDVISVKKRPTASTLESSVWSDSMAQLMKEQDDEYNSDEDGGENEFFFTPEGITRIPFAMWEVDLLGTSKLSSYFQGNSYSPVAAGQSKKAPKASFSQDKFQTYSNTPLNSPLPRNS